MKYQLSTQVFDKKLIPSLQKWVINANVREVLPEGGKTFENVAIWKDQKDGNLFPNFDAIKGGDIIDGNLYTNPGTGKHTLYPFAEKKGFAGGGAPAKMMAQKAEAITKAQDRKEESIENAQERKDHSIMVASTSSGATDIIVAQWGSVVTKDNWMEEWLKVRHWLVANYGNLEQQKVAGTDIDYPIGPNGEDVPF